MISWSFPDDFKWTQKLYHYFHDDIDLQLGLCPVCGKRCKFKSFTTGYCKTCSVSCGSMLSRKLAKETMIKRYGIDSYAKTDEFIEKCKETCNERYGKDYYVQTDDFKEKRVQTYLENYGQENPSQVEEIQNKKIKTFLDKYGCENPSQSSDIKRIKKQTCLKNHGVESPLQSSDIKQKARQTNLKKYGTEFPIQLDDFKDKQKQTNLEKYGTVSALQNADVHEKSKQTMIERYGVENYAKSYQYHKTKKHKFFSDVTNETYDSRWEMMLAEFCFENHIKYTYQPEQHFEYEFEGKTHIYQPDFLINGQIYEVKGDHFFDGDKMVNPYSRTEYNDGLSEAKHQCMLKNHVIILREKDIKNLKEVIK